MKPFILFDFFEASGIIERFLKILKNKYKNLYVTNFLYPSIG